MESGFGSDESRIGVDPTEMNALKVKRRIESPQTGLIGNISLLRVSRKSGLQREDESRLSHPDMNGLGTDY